MSITIDHKIYRNIQEQVEKNKRDIAAWSNIQFTLNSFGITVLGRVDAEADIPEGTYSYGDAYLVGTEEPYDIYIFTRDGEDGEFINMGPLSIVGPQGAKGDQGDAGTITVGNVTTGAAGTSAQVTNSGTAQNAVFNFVIPKGDKGDTGPQGNVGPKGDTGERGPIGLTGPQGDAGQSFMIIATITNTSQLPDPTETPRNYAYVLKDGDQLTPDLIYFITGAVGSEVWSYASFAQIGTTVSVNGNPVSAFNADTKQDAPSEAGTVGQVLTQGTNGPEWANITGGSQFGIDTTTRFSNMSLFRTFLLNNYAKIKSIECFTSSMISVNGYKVAIGGGTPASESGFSLCNSETVISLIPICNTKSTSGTINGVFCELVLPKNPNSKCHLEINDNYIRISYFILDSSGNIHYTQNSYDMTTTEYNKIATSIRKIVYFDTLTT